MIPIDYHLHSNQSCDCQAPMLDMCEAAARAGLREVCFAEHLDFDRSDPGYGFFNYERYLAAVVDARARYGGRLTIRTGIEFDYCRAYGREVGDVLAEMPLDFRIGSVHTVLGCPLYHLHMQPAERIDARALQAAYLDEVLALVDSGWSHCLGHFDYLYKQAPAVFGAWRDAWYWQRVEAILDRCIAMGVALEVNTHHLLDQGLALAADGEILRRYRARGGALLVVGSDAHRPGDVFHGYAEAERQLHEAGFDALTGFEEGRSYRIPMPRG